MKQSIVKWGLLAALSTSAMPAFAVRWFEVELIAFAQKDVSQIREDFSVEMTPLPTEKRLDLLTQGYNNVGHQSCLSGDPNYDPRSVTERFTRAQSSWYCDDDINYVERYDILPVVPMSEPLEHMQSMYLLAPEQLKFESIRKKLERKGHTAILHTGWRFPDQSKKRAPNVVVYGGKKYSEPASYIYNQTHDDNFISLLERETKPTIKSGGDTLWELDGTMKIHIRHYLYVTSNFDYRYTSDEGELESARMSQFTRVYSGDIHYLDHPKMGIIFQIRKYKH
ncbi:CsiV family protein [Pseudoalteromonas luteoviolacea]|uniref:Uncharacterized protein n=1 Tax=Pseudoalteromonas luteoviolacea S4054 TaxID=1129367 RepID=A0A0F6AG24_9GAMM|nr:CsiV family protein [Pseudoalteromonas luteoviolacea]AOT08362.1 hypothetical protein S4054249_11125 [Pseudoalteromonas luteoviolacea]AOT13278.1 hypothetical protein S40542_11100 [Pseudoalteromonas luteoviolacea]AOT18191.1 hypothetical protein S4054_11100 [Pseudoalteromonas luteoviolacea]KKE84309.1 hypothetical protein N479_10440 [Pseudoalteromonas luteoviolacea S4054]KZN76086.1 hypothetical protein N481_06975 [Pseudoalteromonas luteoviolacea S4047-1]